MTPIINPRWQIRGQRSLEKLGGACAKAMGVGGVSWEYQSVLEGGLNGTVWYHFRQIALSVPRRTPTLSVLGTCQDLIGTGRCAAALYQLGCKQWDATTLLKAKMPTSRNKRRVVVHELCHLLLRTEVGVPFFGFNDGFEEWEAHHKWPFAEQVCDWCETLFGWRHP